MLLACSCMAAGGAALASLRTRRWGYRRLVPFVCAVVGTGMPARAASFSQSAFATPGPPLKILGFGDSLTAGWHDNGMTLTPYAPALETALRDILGPVMVRHKGLPGESPESKARKADLRRHTTDTRWSCRVDRAVNG